MASLLMATQTAIATPPPVALTAARLQQEVRAALASHPAIRPSVADLNGATHRLSADRWARYPALSASASRANNGDSVRVWELRQPLWAGGRIDGAIDASESRVEAASYRQEETARALAEQIVQTAIDLARTEAQISSATENLSSLKALLDSIRRRTDGGLGLMSDVTLAKSRVELARATLTQFELAREQARAQWLSLTSQDAPGQFVAEPIELPRTAVTELVTQAKSNSPTLARLRAEANAAAGDAEVIRARGWPQLSLRYQHTRQSGSIDQSEDQTLAVIEFQPDAGLGVADSVRAAEAARESLIHQIAQAEREVENTTRSVHAELDGLNAQIRAIEANIAAASDVIDSFVRQYNIGKRTWLDVLNAQREIGDSRLQLADARHRRLAAHYRLLLLTGLFFES